MPDIHLRVQVGDAVELVMGVATQLEDPTVLMQDHLLIMLRSTQITFEQQGRPDKWTVLAQSTIEARLQKNAGGKAALKGVQGMATGKGKFGKAAVKAQEKFFAAVGEIKILRDTGALLMGVGGSASGAFEAEMGFGESDQFTATLASTHPGAYALQFVIAGGRPFLVIQQIDEEDIMDTTVQFVMSEGPYAE